MMFTYQRPATSVVASHCELPGPCGRTGISCPSRIASALTVNRTVALEFPAGSADVMWSEDTLMDGAPLPIDD